MLRATCIPLVVRAGNDPANCIAARPGCGPPWRQAKKGRSRKWGGGRGAAGL